MLFITSEVYPLTCNTNLIQLIIQVSKLNEVAQLNVFMYIYAKIQNSSNILESKRRLPIEFPNWIFKLEPHTCIKSGQHDIHYTN